MNCREHLNQRQAWCFCLISITLLNFGGCTPRLAVRKQVSGQLEFADKNGQAFDSLNCFIVKDASRERYLVLSWRKDSCSDSLSEFPQELVEGANVQLQLDRLSTGRRWSLLFRNASVTKWTVILKQDESTEDTVTVWEKGKFMIPAYTSPDICVSRTRMVQSKAPN